MLVCHCLDVSERTIRRCIRDGAESVGEIASRCQAGTDCGGCRPVIEELLEADRLRRAPADCPAAPNADDEAAA